MGTKHPIKVFALAVTVIVVLVITISVTGTAFADEPLPNPFIAVSITEHWFWVNNFTPESLVTFSIYDDKDDGKLILEFSKPTDEMGNLTIEGWEHIWDPEPGDYIVATDEYIKKDLILEYITLDVFDPENDVLSGKAAYSGRSVDIGVGNETGEQWMKVTADDEGLWEADFKKIFDITENSWAGAHVNDDDGDVTAAHNFGPPEPPAWFTAFPEQNVVEGWDWPLGAKVHLAIFENESDTLPKYEQDETVVFAPWGSWQLWVWFDFDGAYKMEVGDIVTLTYGETVRTHIVRNLSVATVDQADDTVKGVADPGVEVHVWPYATGQEQLTMAKKKGNAEGKWNADFSGDFDLTPGECGRSEIYDDAGNRTAVDWCVPSTRFTVWPEWNYLEGYEWPVRDEVSISVAGKEACSTEATPAYPEWDPWNTFFSVYFPEGCTLEAEDLITLSSENFSFTHQIQELTITEVNIDDDIVTGTAVFDPERYFLHTWIHEVDGSYMQMSAEDDTWLADFGSQGFGLQPGMGGRVELVDQASNATAVDWSIPNP